MRAFAKCVRSVYQSGKDQSWLNMHLVINGSYMGENDKIERSLTDDESVILSNPQ
jgi:hypothetical protein